MNTQLTPGKKSALSLAVAFLFAATVISQPSTADEVEGNAKRTRVAWCQTPFVADAGYIAFIFQEPGKKPNSYRTTLEISEGNFGGNIPLGTSRVEIVKTGPITRLIGKDVQLDIFDRVAIPGRESPGADKRVRDAYLSGEKIEYAEFSKLRCTFYSELKGLQLDGTGVRPDRNVCMAYWTGAVFNTTTRSCMQIGTSGCSNPFEFQNLDSCNDAYTLK